MWGSGSATQLQGGFTNSPSASGGESGGKARRAQNVVPVLIDHVLRGAEEGFSIEGTEVGMVKLVARVMSMEKTATKSTYQIEDSTGSIECIQWVDEGQREDEFAEGTYVKLIGSVRTQGDRKHIMTIRMAEVPTEEEKDFHALEVAYSHLKLKQINNRLGMGGGMDGGLPNSMMNSSSFGGMGTLGAGMSSSASSNQFGNKNYDMVYGYIKRCSDDQGLNIGSLFNEIRNKMSKKEMDDSIEYLSSEGHIYSTVDDEHYKVTDED